MRDGKTMSFAKAMSDIKSSFATGHIKGEKPKPASFELGVPYKGQTLTGDALQTQLDKWVRLGVIELSAGAQISQVARSAPWLDLSDRYFVLLGAGAAMGPFQLLLNHGVRPFVIDKAKHQTICGLACDKSAAASGKPGCAELCCCCCWCRQSERG